MILEFLKSCYSMEKKRKKIIIDFTRLNSEKVLLQP